MEPLITPHSWECRTVKAARLIKAIKADEKVKRWEVFPLRFILIDLAGTDQELKDKINHLVDLARESL